MSFAVGYQLGNLSFLMPYEAHRIALFKAFSFSLKPNIHNPAGFTVIRETVIFVVA